MNDWYDEIGKGYINLLVPDTRIAKLVRTALGDVESVANIGAGAGNYEPEDCEVIAIEPSSVMLGQYQGKGARLQGTAETLPLATGSVDATMGILTLHHWKNWRQGIDEMLRVSRKAAMLLTHTPDLFDFWLLD
ncbi:MAG TPA: hypothetical protein DCM54_16310 [Gammaproteobacteria bacterium]|nr:hypothetical protein [Gammaproteobacteria bacterium]|tara:strand:- start:327 stop:728 length:402 start_codon:yes stop_codon:yes gene_type:complete